MRQHLTPSAPLTVPRVFLATIISCLVLCFALHQARGEWLPWDELLKTMEWELTRLGKGADRREILKLLEEAGRANPGSHYQRHLADILRDLHLAIEEASLEKKGAEDSPERLAGALIDSKAETFSALFCEENRPLLEELVKGKSDDPAVRLFRMGDQAIPALLESLESMALTRAPLGCPEGSLPDAPRRCDLAYCLVERISRCRFTTGGGFFSKRKPEERHAITEEIRRFCRETEDKSPAERLVWQIQEGKVSGSLFLDAIRSLVALDEKERALSLLRQDYARIRVSEPRFLAAHASLLADMGDLSPMEDVYMLVKGWTESDLGDANAIFHLLRYGGLREYDLLERLAQKGGAGSPHELRSRAMTIVINAGDRPLAIPVLAAALLDEEEIHGGSGAGRAIERFERLTGMDFGHDPAGTRDARLEATRKARAWWEQEGEACFGLLALWEGSWKKAWEDLPAARRDHVERLVRELGNGEYKARERASLELKRLGSQAGWACFKTFRNSDDSEIRMRTAEILDFLRGRD